MEVVMSSSVQTLSFQPPIIASISIPDKATYNVHLLVEHSSAHCDSPQSINPEPSIGLIETLTSRRNHGLFLK